MKALTACQPYAHLIVTGEKRVENRTRPTSHRESLAIHAGKRQRFLFKATKSVGHRSDSLRVGACDPGPAAPDRRQGLLHPPPHFACWRLKACDTVAGGKRSAC